MILHCHEFLLVVSGWTKNFRSWAKKFSKCNFIKLDSFIKCKWLHFNGVRDWKNYNCSQLFHIISIHGYKRGSKKSTIYYFEKFNRHAFIKYCLKKKQCIGKHIIMKKNYILTCLRNLLDHSIQFNAKQNEVYFYRTKFDGGEFCMLGYEWTWSTAVA